MGLLRLLFKLDADASGLKSKLHAAERDMTGFARRSARDFRTVFTTFFSISAMRQMVRSVFQFAEKYATDDKFKEKVNALGVTINDVAVDSLMKLQLEFQSFGYQLASTVIPALAWAGKATLGFIQWVEEAAAIMGVLSTKIPTYTSEKDIATAAAFIGAPAAEMEAAKAFINSLKENFSSDAIWSEVGVAIGEVAQRAADRAARAEAYLQTFYDSKKKKENTYTDAEAATGQTKRDSLASIGGFTSRADMEIQSLSKRQLRELEKISNDTKNLNIGVGG